MSQIELNHLERALLQMDQLAYPTHYPLTILNMAACPQMIPRGKQVRSECALKPWLPWHPIDACEPLTNQRWQSTGQSGLSLRPLGCLPLLSPALGPGALHTTPGAPHLCPPTPPPPHDYPCLAQLLHTPHICAPNLHACCVLGQGLMPINFQLRVRRLTFPVKT